MRKEVATWKREVVHSQKTGHNFGGAGGPPSPRFRRHLDFDLSGDVDPPAAATAEAGGGAGGI